MKTISNSTVSDVVLFRLGNTRIYIIYRKFKLINATNLISMLNEVPRNKQDDVLSLDVGVVWLLESRRNKHDNSSFMVSPQSCI